MVTRWTRSAESRSGASNKSQNMRIIMIGHDGLGSISCTNKLWELCESPSIGASIFFGSNRLFHRRVWVLSIDIKIYRLDQGANRISTYLIHHTIGNLYTDSQELGVQHSNKQRNRLILYHHRDQAFLTILSYRNASDRAAARLYRAHSTDVIENFSRTHKSCHHEALITCTSSKSVSQ